MQDLSQYTVADQARMILGADTGAYVELRAVHPTLTGKDKVKRGWFRHDELDRLERRVATLAESRNVYLGAAPRNVYGGGGAAHVLFTPVVWADCDTPESVDRLRAFHPVPTLVVESSPGKRQAWWALTPDSCLTADCEPVLDRLAAAIGADTGCCDRAHVMRAVGTRNFKHDPPASVFARFFSGELHHLASVLEHTPEVLHAAKPGAGRGEHKAVERVPAGERHEYLKDFAVRLLRGGITDRACIESCLWAEFHRICEPEPGRGHTIPGIAKWAAEKSEIAERENARAEFVARWNAGRAA